MEWFGVVWCGMAKRGRAAVFVRTVDCITRPPATAPLIITVARSDDGRDIMRRGRGPDSRQTCPPR